MGCITSSESDDDCEPLLLAVFLASTVSVLVRMVHTVSETIEGPPLAHVNVLVVVIVEHPCERVVAKVIELLHDVDPDWLPQKVASSVGGPVLVEHLVLVGGEVLVEHLGLMGLPSAGGRVGLLLHSAGGEV